MDKLKYWWKDYLDEIYSMDLQLEFFQKEYELDCISY
jgi:hypothetical protein